MPALFLCRHFCAATVYRMFNLLEEIGAINRKNMYRISCSMNCNKENACVIELDDQTFLRLSSDEWYKVISEGLRCLGYVGTQKVSRCTGTYSSAKFE